ncbi:hypothetical protein T484DRAFT_3639579 [Baffinella frigidus]|nr:hypothetical protein T484DRAFT_3639579 [Cryptophyta sp. CCMP2293]
MHQGVARAAMGLLLSLSPAFSGAHVPRDAASCRRLGARGVGVGWGTMRLMATPLRLSGGEGGTAGGLNLPADQPEPVKPTDQPQVVPSDGIDAGQAKRDAVAALQRAVFGVLPSAARVEGFELRLNPHLWPKEDQRDVYSNPGAARGGPPSPAELRPWSQAWAGSVGWGGSVLDSLVARHPGLNASDLRLAYHGAKNSHRVSCIL